MAHPIITRREFLRRVEIAIAGAALSPIIRPLQTLANEDRPVVSIVKMRDDDVGRAVEEAIDLLGGVETITASKQRIMLKPNLVNNLDFGTFGLKKVHKGL